MQKSDLCEVRYGVNAQIILILVLPSCLPACFIFLLISSHLLLAVEQKVKRPSLRFATRSL